MHGTCPRTDSRTCPVTHLLCVLSVLPPLWTEGQAQLRLCGQSRGQQPLVAWHSRHLGTTTCTNQAFNLKHQRSILRYANHAITRVPSVYLLQHEPLKSQGNGISPQSGRQLKEKTVMVSGLRPAATPRAAKFFPGQELNTSTSKKKTLVKSSIQAR